MKIAILKRVDDYIQVESGSMVKITTVKNTWVVSSLHVSSLHRRCRNHVPIRAPLPSTHFLAFPIPV